MNEPRFKADIGSLLPREFHIKGAGCKAEHPTRRVAGEQQSSNGRLRGGAALITSPSAGAKGSTRPLLWLTQKESGSRRELETER